MARDWHSKRSIDELWTKINIEFYKDASDAVFKSLVERAHAEGRSS